MFQEHGLKSEKYSKQLKIDQVVKVSYEFMKKKFTLLSKKEISPIPLLQQY